MPILLNATSPAIDAGQLGADFARADLEFEGLEHAGSSYEGRVFLNNPDADADTETTLDHGYGGSFYIFGHGGCFGDEGHCDVGPRLPYDPRPPHALWPLRKVVIATEAIRRAAASGSVTITVVPVLLSTTEKVAEDEQIPKFEVVSVITYQ